jgi:predicted DCC family thiol-disulfide oxidoreductase YuxK
MIIFFDGYCPLCAIEMKHLRRHDKKGALQFEDIQASDFLQRYPQLDWQALNARIHVMFADGSIVTGLDATHAMWKAVGKGWLYAPLRWPVIRWVADKAYNAFARHRYTISFWLTGKSRLEHCERCVK